MEISLNKFTHRKLEVSNSAKRHTAAETVRPSNRWPLKANFSRNLFTGQIDQTRSLLQSEHLRKFWLLDITCVYHTRHLKHHFASDKQTRCWYKLSKVTNQRVYQELEYQNEAYRLSCRPLFLYQTLLVTHPLFQLSTPTESLEQAISKWI